MLAVRQAPIRSAVRAVIAAQNLFVGLNGTGVFTHSGGTTMITATGTGVLDVGTFAGAQGTYNLSNAGQVMSNNTEYIGDQGIGLFNQTGGTNTIVGSDKDLFSGFAAGSNGTYSISAGTLTIGDDLIIGGSGTGIMTISGTANVSVNENTSWASIRVTRSRSTMERCGSIRSTSSAHSNTSPAQSSCPALALSAEMPPSWNSLALAAASLRRPQQGTQFRAVRGQP